MRIVACRAAQPAGTFQEAFGFQKSVSCPIHRHPLVGRRRDEFEIDRVVAERFARTVGEHRSVESSNRIGKRAAGRLQMALQADFELATARELCRVGDGIARIFGMRLSRPVAPLAINPLGEAAVRLRWISVVTEQAGIGDFSREIGMVGAVITGAHPPGTCIFRIPTERKLDQSSAGIPVYERVGVIAGADDEVYSLLEGRWHPS